jgi:hypothetical protein
MRGILLAVGLALSVSAVAHAEGNAVIINAGNDSSDVGPLRIRRLYLLQSARWSNGEKVKPVDFAGSAAHDGFLTDVLRMTDDELERHWIELSYQRAVSPAKQLASEEEVLSYVAAEKGAIGFVSAKAARSATGVKVVHVF